MHHRAALITTVVALSSILPAPSAKAAAGDIDTTFSSDGWAITAEVRPDPNTAFHPKGIEDIAVQPDGKIVAVGEIRGWNYEQHFGVFRYTRDGELDPSFGNGGWTIDDFSTSEFPRSVELQKDGKIVVSGDMTCGDWTIGFFSCFTMVRYNVDGLRDATFGQAGVAQSLFGVLGPGLDDMAIQDDGKIVAVGSTGNYGPDRYVNSGFTHVIRYRSDGSLDSSFSGDGRVSIDIGKGFERGHAVQIQRDGKIVVAGESFENFAVVRLRPNGRLDRRFSRDGKQTVDFGVNRQDYAYSLDIQSDGRLLLAGITKPHPNSAGGVPRIALARLNRNGSLDGTFARGGKRIMKPAPYGGYALAVMQHPDRRILVAGVGYMDATVGLQTDIVLARYRVNGTPDPAFGGDGIVTVNRNPQDGASALGIQPDGKIITSGGLSYQSTAQVLLRYHAM